MNRIKILSVLFLSIILLIGCNPEDDVPQETLLNVVDEELVYMGEVEDKMALSITMENDTVKCYIRTIFVMKEDSLKSITASIIEDYLHITVETSPYNNPEWYDTEKLTESHDIKFNILDLEKGTYKLRLIVNNSFKFKDGFVIE